MAIKFDCPHCGHHYRLKDELAGKVAACKNCRNKITIPTVSDNTPLPSPPVDVEAAALAALADAPKVEEDPSKKVIEVECNYCSHKWTEPISRAGKNTLCPNPECKQRVKIPEPKPDQTSDWRQVNTKLPSLAKENKPQQLEGVQDAADVKQLSDATLREKVIEIEYEPRPMRFWVMAIGGPLLLLVALAGGIWYGIQSNKEARDDNVMKDAQTTFASTEFAKPDPKASKDAKDEAAQFTAVMNMAGAEYALRHPDDPQQFAEAQKQYRDAMMQLRSVNSLTRNAILAELVVAKLSLGGTEEQVREKTRLRWLPDDNLKVLPNTTEQTLLKEFQDVLRLLQGTDFEFRTQVARRLTRELVMKHKQPGMVDAIPLALFTAKEHSEANAIIALELYRIDKESKQARTIATNLAKLGPQLTNLAEANPKPVAAHALFIALKIEKAPAVVGGLPPNGPIANDVCFAHTCAALIQEKPPAEVLAIAQRGRSPEDRVHSLVLCACWMNDPSLALDAALPIVTDAANRPKEVKLSPYWVLRLTQVAAEKNKIEQANMFANAISDEGLKAWAKGEIIRIRLANAPNDKGEESWLEPLPEKSEKYRVGHAWARLWLARQNTRITGNKSEQVKTVNGWAAPFSSFGKAGVALGIQDRDK